MESAETSANPQTEKLILWAVFFLFLAVLAFTLSTYADETERLEALGLSERQKKAQLDALERHLRKGRDPGTWDARHLPGDVLDVVRFDLGDGQSITTAVADAKTALAKTGG